MEKFVVLNPTHGNISFVIYPATIADSVAHLSSHKRRRLVRGKATPVNVVSRHSVDLVALTGFSIAEIKETPELHKFISYGLLTVLEDTSAPEVVPPPVLPDPAKAPPPVLPPINNVVIPPKLEEPVNVRPPKPSKVVPPPVLDPIQEFDPVEKEDAALIEKVIVEELEEMSKDLDKQYKLKEDKKLKKGKTLFKKKGS